VTTVTNGRGSSPAFRMICEVRPPVRPALDGVRRQIAMLGRGTDAILVTENAIGVPSISSLAVAREVTSLGRKPIAVLNARDRNLIGLYRDLLTAAASGTDEFLFVGGDPVVAPHTALTVRSMLEESRRFCDKMQIAQMTIGVATGTGVLPLWKRGADALFVQATFCLDELLAWREQTAFGGPVYAGVLVPPSASRARRWNNELPGVTVPDELIAELDDDPIAGVAFACDFVDRIASSGAFEGVHITPGIRHRELAAHLDLRLCRVAVERAPI